MALSSMDRPGALVRAQALALPGAWADNPWGAEAFKVGRRIFALLSSGAIAPGQTAAANAGLSLLLKLPASADFALMFNGCTPARYGLGPHGWVECRLMPAEAGDMPFDPDLIPGWVVESYRAVAPKRLVRELG
ncbi:MmcQ/YjbR family DNA-binding protein [Sandaracinobacteroides sp. A072]|uniref:MmcQ/YjbR family DNA-binding protein n=1 Tax=Sandaracinobacteroides sp. A072 TaxID=3461146 RepID=UPI00404130A0